MTHVPIVPALLRSFALAALWFGLAAPGAAVECGTQTPCKVGDRGYYLRVPDSWDGSSPLPVLLHFHGWGRQGNLVIGHGRIAIKAIASDVLLLAPNGLGGSWSFRRPGSADTTFARAVIEDAATKFPIDPDQIFVSGYSWGSNMAWRFVCEDGDDIAALLAISGTLSQSESCETAPGAVRQVFGLDDQVLPFPIGPEKDLAHPVSLWRDKLGCADGQPVGTWAARPWLSFDRTVWDCARGNVVMDVHPGGHFIPHDWLPLQVGDLLAGGTGTSP